ncbi:MAG: DUF5666 domain-containing protein [Microgenomates group bacterium]
MKKNLIITIVVAVLIGGICFFAGTKYQQSKQRSVARQFVGQMGGRQGTGVNRLGFRPVNGEIISADDKSITVKLQDGSSKIVLVSDNTQINKAQQATKEDLKVGEKVAVFGTENSDGSVTAQNIQLNPVLRGVSFGQQPTGVNK